VASGAATFNRLGFESRRALVNGAPGVVSFADGQPLSVVGFTVAGGRIVEMNIRSDPDRLRQLDLAAVEP
jgi:RNA polymerase sigma-70 factor (ECF subfamily)